MTTVRRSVEQTISRLVRQTLRERAQFVGLPNARADACAALASLLDYTPPQADLLDVVAVCVEALRYGFGCIVVPLAKVTACVDELGGSGVRVGVCVESLAELDAALRAGATEIEIKPATNILKDNQQFTAWLGDLRGHGDGRFILKLDLTDPTLSSAVLLQICARIGTPTVDGVTIPLVLLPDVEQTINPDVAIKVDGIATLDDARQTLAAGATRLGTAYALAMMAAA